MAVFVHNPYGYALSTTNKQEEEGSDYGSTSSCSSLCSSATVTSSSELIADSERHGSDTTPMTIFSHLTTRRPPPQPETPIICLDHLKGVCEKKRWKCKYMHPRLPLAVSLTEDEDSVCAVYMLTGVCPRGSSCSSVHSRDLPLPFLRSVASNSFDDSLQRIMQGLCSPTSPDGFLTRVILSLYATAAHEPALSPLSARLISSVVMTLAPSQQHAVADYLAELTAGVLRAAGCAIASGKAHPTIYTVQRGSVLILGEAIAFGVCSAPCTYAVLDILLRSNNGYQRDLAMDLLKKMSHN